MSRRAGMAVARAVWKRDMLRLRRERSRWLGVLAQPLLFWLLLSFGFADTFRIEDQPELSFRTFFYPGVLVMVILFTAIFGMISVIEDRQSGFLQGVLVAPASRMWLVLGKTASVTSIVALQTALFLLVLPAAGIAVTQVAWPFVILLILTASALLCAVNFIMAWLMDSTAAFHAVMSVVLLPLWVLSGAVFPVGDGVFGWLMRINPMTWVVEGLRAGFDSSSMWWPEDGGILWVAVAALTVPMLFLAARSARVR